MPWGGRHVAFGRTHRLCLLALAPCSCLGGNPFLVRLVIVASNLPPLPPVALTPGLHINSGAGGIRPIALAAIAPEAEPTAMVLAPGGCGHECLLPRGMVLPAPQ